MEVVAVASLQTFRSQRAHAGTWSARGCEMGQHESVKCWDFFGRTFEFCRCRNSRDERNCSKYRGKELTQKRWSLCCRLALTSGRLLRSVYILYVYAHVYGRWNCGLICIRIGEATKGMRLSERTRRKQRTTIMNRRAERMHNRNTAYNGAFMLDHAVGFLLFFELQNKFKAEGACDCLMRKEPAMQHKYRN
jgi:hypothetical protein